MLMLFGYSDDIVEVEGLRIDKVCQACGHVDEEPTSGHVESGIRKEIGCYDQNVEFVVGDPDTGAVEVTMHYNVLGVWSATVGRVLEDIPVPWPVVISDGHKELDIPPYSVVVMIECPDGTEVTWKKVAAS